MKRRKKQRSQSIEQQVCLSLYVCEKIITFAHGNVSLLPPILALVLTLRKTGLSLALTFYVLFLETSVYGHKNNGRYLLFTWCVMKIL